EALKIKALAGMPGKKAKFEFLMNQPLTSAIAFIASVAQMRDCPDRLTLFLCISAIARFSFGPKQW
ncbi:MAG: hypothetical protein V4627_02300, partial [Pseudomonadota bacterium]